MSSFTANLPAASLSGTGAGSLTLDTPVGSITIPGNMLAGTGLTGSAGVTFGEGSKDGLPDNVKNALGDRPAIQLTLTIGGVQTEWNNPDAPVTVSIPYTPTAAELANPESIVVWYIDAAAMSYRYPTDATTRLPKR